MKIKVEQFLALTVALGAAGAVGAAVYTTGDSFDELIGRTNVEVNVQESLLQDEPPAPMPTTVAVAATPVPVEPTEPLSLDELAGIPAIGTDADDGSDYRPGPDVEGADW